MDATAPLKVDLSTTDPDQAHAWLSNHYVPQEALLSGDSRQFYARNASATFGRLTINTFEDSMSTRLRLAPSENSVIMVQPIEGRYGAVSDDCSVVAEPGNALVLNPDAQHHASWTPGIRLIAWQFDRSELGRIAAERTGKRDSAPHFPLSLPLSSDKKREWQRLVRRVNRELLDEGASATPLLVSRAFRLAATALLDCFANTSLGAETATGYDAPGTLRRAIAFVEESAHQDIDVCMIAEAARTEPDRLCRTFRERLQCTPMQYLERARLERAHNELRVADSAGGTSIADVAAYWGFRPGTFAAKYQLRYGRLPSATLLG